MKWLERIWNMPCFQKQESQWKEAGAICCRVLLLTFLAGLASIVLCFWILCLCLMLVIAIFDGIINGG